MKQWYVSMVLLISLLCFFFATLIFEPSDRQSRTITITAATHMTIQLATTMLFELLALKELLPVDALLITAELRPIAEVFVMAGLLAIK